MRAIHVIAYNYIINTAQWFSMLTVPFFWSFMRTCSFNWLAYLIALAVLILVC